MLTATGIWALVLGAATYAVGWLFGTTPLYPVGVGLVVVVGLALVWVQLLAKPVRLVRTLGDERPVDGDDVPVRIALELDGSLRPASVELHDGFVDLGEQSVELRRDGDVLAGTYVLEAVPRGRYRAADVAVVVEDPLGLVRRERRLHAPGGLLVAPRLVELDDLFADGRRLSDGRRLLIRRQSGFDLHSVREHAQGESLRRVHWPSTARRGKLMVKELEDAPRDEAVVLLDGEAAQVVGGGRDTTFELALRAAGSIARVHLRRGRRVGLLVNDSGRSYQPITSLDGDWALAVELLSAAEPDGRRQASSLLAEGSGPAASATDLVVVTSALNARLADRLLQRSVARRGTSLVYVDPTSFGIAPASSPSLDAKAQLLRLERSGVPAVVLRREDDLATALSGRPAVRERVG